MGKSNKKQPGKNTTGKSHASPEVNDNSVIYNGDHADQDNRRINLQLLFIAAAISLLVLFTYRGAFNNEFVDWDDFNYVVNNDLVRNPGNSFLHDLFITPVSSNYHPLTILSMRLNSNVCETCPNGISPAPFIVWNVILHITNTLLVLLLVFLLSKRNIIIAMLSALFFGLHPMHVESVAWISERKDVLYTLFFLSGLITYLSFIKGGRRNVLLYLVTFILFIASCLSKATAVVFPAGLILIDFMVYAPEEEKPMNALKNAFSLKKLLWLAPFFIISVFTGLMAYKIQNGENFLGLLDLSKNAPDVVNEVGAFTVFQRFQIGCFGFISYIIRFFVPVNLLAIHPFPSLQDFSHGSFAAMFILSVIGVLTIAITVILSLRKTRLYAFSLGFYFVSVALVLQVVTVGISMISDRYSYLPYVWLSLVPASLIANSLKTKRTLMLIVSGCFVGMLMIISIRQIEVWSNTVTLWTKVINKYPHEEVPRRSRGKYYSRKSGQARNDTERKVFEDKALVDFTEAIRAGTRSSDVFMGAGIIRGSKGDLKNALLLLNSALAIDPEKGSAYYNRALIFDQLNMKEEGIRDYDKALIYKPDLKLEILNNRSNLLLETGRFREAILDFDYLISLGGNNFYYYSNRGIARQQINDIPGAMADFKKALALQPDDSISATLLQKLQNGIK
jgi:tetratricopeptide (TPR) repeat protein